MGLLKSKEGRNVAGIAAMIPLVPADKIPATWCYVINQAPNSSEMHRFRKYFEKQWYPKMSTTLLTCAFQRHRTTNAVEGWHRRVNTGRIPRKPSLYMFVFKLKKESKYWDREIRNSLFKNVRHNRRELDISFDKKYKALLVQLERNNLTLPQFIKSNIFTVNGS